MHGQRTGEAALHGFHQAMWSGEDAHSVPYIYSGTEEEKRAPHPELDKRIEELLTEQATPF